MTKLGIMSFAHMHAYSYATAIAEVPDTALVAIWDDDAVRGEAMAAQFKVPFVRDPAVFLALPDLEGVIICSENIKHRPMVEAAAQAGKWILCEKPLATTVEDARAMVDFCEKQGVGLGTAFPCRYVTPLMEVQKQIAEGYYGEIYAAACTNNGSLPGGWFVDEAMSGGGATMDHTVHVADLLRWLFGREIVKVYCENSNLIHPEMGLEDTGCMQFEMEGGIKVSHLASWNRAKSFPTWGDVTMELIGEKGVVWIDAFKQRVNVYNNEALRAEWAGWGDNSDLGLVRDFAQSIREKRSPSITGYDGLKAVEVTVAAYRSAREKKMVAV